MKHLRVQSIFAIAAIALSACAGQHTVPQVSTNLSQTEKKPMATATCAPAWVEGGTYNAGQVVSYNPGSGTHNYTALVTQTDYAGTGWNPTVGSLYADDGSCGGSSTSSPKPTPTPTKTASPTPTPTKTASPTPKPTATATSPGAGCYAAWNASTAYNGGAQVSYKSVNYTAAYWTQGNEPDTSNGPAGSGQPWISDGACGGGTSSPSPSPTPTKTASPSPTPKPTVTPTSTPTSCSSCGLTPADVSDAESKPAPAYDTSSNQGDSPHIVLQDAAFFDVTLEATINPSDTAAFNSAVSKFNSLMSGGHEPHVSNPLYGWGDGAVGDALVLFRKNSALWNAIGASGQNKANLVMAAFIADANYSFNDGNNPSSGIGGGGNFSKTNNPNYDGYLYLAIDCAIYFGSPSACNNVLTSFNYNTFVGNVTSAGLTNIESSFSATGSSMNAAVTKPWVYAGIAMASDSNYVLDQYYANTISGAPEPLFTGGAIVSSEGSAHTVNNASGNPYLGLLWMLKEFNSTDSTGTRSDADYSFEGWMNALRNRAVLQYLGLWNKSQSNVQTIDQAFVNGTGDLLYKLANCYYSIGTSGDRTVCAPSNSIETNPSTDPVAKGWLYDTDIWNHYIQQ